MSVVKMRTEVRRVALILMLLFLVVAQAGPAFAAEPKRRGAADCSRTSTGAIPLTDLGDATYQDAQGGLYDGGSNDMPSDHQTLGLFQASQIEPLNEAGQPDPNGSIVLVSLGVSNTRMEFGDFMTIAEGATADNVVLVNGSQPGKPISEWVDPSARPWIGVDTALRKADVSGEQIQAAWIKIPERISSFDELEPFPLDAETYKEDLIRVIRNAKDRYPNLRVAYLSSRIYGGYDPNARPNPEPLAYQNGFAVKWTIEDQIDGVAALNADPRKGEVEAPWIAWGPYMWADGTTPRSDGLIWECSDFQNDGTHPTESARRKVGVMLLDHFLSDPAAAPWFALDGIQISDVVLPPLDGDSRASTTTSSPATTTTQLTTTTTTATTTTTTSSATTTTVAQTSTTSDQAAQTQADAERRPGRASSGDRASAVLLLLVVVALLAVVLGVVWLIGRARTPDDGELSKKGEPSSRESG